MARLKNKRSFILIEILLGIFILGIFLTGLIATPKAAEIGAIDSLFSIKGAHLLDITWNELSSKLDTLPLPQKKKEPLKIPLDTINLQIAPKLILQCFQQADCTLIEIKLDEKKPIYFLYECQLSLKTTFRKKPFEIQLPYRFIVSKKQAKDATA
jgi:hypothetical protein